MDVAWRSIIYLDEATSTQSVAATAPGSLVWTTNQTQGRGRHGRTWHTEAQKSLACTANLDSRANHPKPYLIGMLFAVVIARVLDANVQWPNDVTINRKKVCGILTEVVNSVPLIGFGINLTQTTFPAEIAHRATSLELEKRSLVHPFSIIQQIVMELENMPEPTSWSNIQPYWQELDDSEGKLFTLTDGRVGKAVSIDENGALVWTDGLTTETITTAEAMWDNGERSGITHG
jgi:BirA family biotin operon repressor/biotin-[acetyl-CoA-carboxylase] ligase